MDGSAVLDPYVPNLATTWLREQPSALWREVHGSLAFVDISGFTQLTERLAREGKVGAEEMSDILERDLRGPARRSRTAMAASLVKWGGDAVLLLFEGTEHAARAARAAHRMRARLRRIGRVEHAERARSRCGCRSGSTAAPSTSSSSATPRSTASWSSAGRQRAPRPTSRPAPLPARSG